MKKLILLLIATILYSNDIIGTYIVTTIIKNGKVKHPNAQVSFKKDGKYYMMGAPFGQWKSGNDNVVYLNTAFEPKFEKFSVKKSNNELILQNSNGKMVYKRVYPKKANNNGSFLLGTWEYKNKNKSYKITFTKPKGFKCVEEDRLNNTTTKASGEWLYNKSLIITAFGCNLNGKFKVKKENNSLIIDKKRYKRVK